MTHSNEMTTKTTPVPNILGHLPRIDLVNRPTQLQQAKRFSAALGGPAVFIKRDDQTGLATGGNKTRKLEFLIARALSEGADCVVTAGAVQSNHCRQTAAAAAMHGLECHLVFGATPPQTSAGNYFLDQLFGAHFYWTEKHLRPAKMEEVKTSLITKGKKPYLIPVGGSNAIGAMGYVLAMFELTEQLATTGTAINHIVFASSSGGTQAGLILGAQLTNFRGQIRGISIDHMPDERSEFRYRAFVLSILQEAADLLKVGHKFSIDDVHINYDYLGDGYGVVGNLEREAIRTLASTEGILVGPVYTGRALGGSIDMVRNGKIKSNENILFWHTGDDVTLHAYVKDLVYT